MPIRTSELATMLGWFTVFWGALYTTDLTQRADKVTSRQWQYLMSIPGGSTTWAVVFGGGSLLLAAGLVARWYRVRALGFTIISLGSAAVAAFYFIAPYVDPGLTTLGYHVWYAWAAVLFVMALVNVAPVEWF